MTVRVGGGEGEGEATVPANDQMSLVKSVSSPQRGDHTSAALHAWLGFGLGLGLGIGLRLGLGLGLMLGGYGSG